MLFNIFASFQRKLDCLFILIIEFKYNIENITLNLLFGNKYITFAIYLRRRLENFNKSKQVNILSIKFVSLI